MRHSLYLETHMVALVVRTLGALRTHQLLFILTEEAQDQVVLLTPTHFFLHHLVVSRAVEELGHVHQPLCWGLTLKLFSWWDCQQKRQEYMPFRSFHDIWMQESQKLCLQSMGNESLRKSRQIGQIVSVCSMARVFQFSVCGYGKGGPMGDFFFF